MAKGVKELFTPYTVGRVQLKNRLLMLSMNTGMAEDSKVSEQLIKYYTERARGGVGLIIIASLSPTQVYPDPTHKGSLFGLGIYSDELIPGRRKLTKAIHDGGAKAGAQLSLRYKWRATKDAPLEGLGSSAEPAGRDSPQLRAATVDEIHQIVEEYGEAARRAREADFDMVEIMSGMSYFLSRFLSSRSNRRTDEYGGSIENRMRILLEIIESAKKKAGSDYTYICRLSADEFVEGGNTLEDTKKMAAVLEKAGIAAIDVEAGTHDSSKPLVQQWVPPGAFVYLAEEIKRVVNIPVIAAYRIVDAFLAEEIIAKGKADLVGMVRALIADPEFPNKAREGRFDEIRRCICCCRCLDNEFSDIPTACSVNAGVGRELEVIEPARESKNVLVIGSGPSGMEAARIAALRGHKVTLCEKSRRLGGLMVLGAVLNKELEPLVKWMRAQIKRLPIEVRMRTEVTPALLEGIKPDIVILAAGGKPIIPEIPGISGDNVISGHHILDLLNGIPSKRGALWRLLAPLAKYFSRPSLMRYFLRLNFPIKKRVAIIGGQFAGCELALALVEKGKEVTVIEESNRIGADIGMVTRWVELAMLRKAGVKLETLSKVTEITDKGVKISREGSSEFLEVDTVLSAMGNGVEANTKLVQELEEKAPVLYPIGDCADPSKIKEAIASGFNIGSKI